MQIDIQLNPATTPWPQLRDGVLAAERGGFGAFWMVDHLAGRSMRGATMMECFTTLGALAVETSTITLGTLVANVHNRTPGTLAVAAATLDHIGARRVLLGLGAGAAPTGPFAAEQLAVGAPIGATLATRHEAVLRTLDVLDALWAGDATERFATFPVPRQRPLIVLGVNGPELARIAARRADGVNVRWSHPTAIELLHVARQQVPAGRPFVATTWAAWDEALADEEHPDRRTMAALGIDRLILAASHPLTPEQILGLAGRARLA